MFNKNDTVDTITKTMGKMIADLHTLAMRREELSAKKLKDAETLKAQAQVDYDESVKARTVAEKLSELVA